LKIKAPPNSGGVFFVPAHSIPPCLTIVKELPLQTGEKGFQKKTRDFLERIS
jgi:hypothetical protein